MVGHSVLHGLGNGKSVEKVVQQVVWQNGARVPVQNVQYPQLPTLKISFILELNSFQNGAGFKARLKDIILG